MITNSNQFSYLPVVLSCISPSRGLITPGIGVPNDKRSILCEKFCTTIVRNVLRCSEDLALHINIGFTVYYRTTLHK